MSLSKLLGLGYRKWKER